MKTPICNVCLNSDILCLACEKKFKQGEVSESDIRICKILNELSKNFKSLENVTIKRIVEGKEIGLIICEKGDAAKIIGKNGIIIKKLSKIVGKEFRVVEETNDFKEFISFLIQPVPIIRINILYKPEGEVLKLVIPKNSKIPIKQTALEEIIRIVFRKGLIIIKE
ncbi:MAG: transcription elongation factor NusA [Candidatus Aenigmatarchaeota archaeon]